MKKIKELEYRIEQLEKNNCIFIPILDESDDFNRYQEIRLCDIVKSIADHLSIDFAKKPSKIITIPLLKDDNRKFSEEK